jgi:hypothetical protein
MSNLNHKKLALNEFQKDADVMEGQTILQIHVNQSPKIGPETSGVPED